MQLLKRIETENFANLAKRSLKKIGALSHDLQTVITSVYFVLYLPILIKTIAFNKRESFRETLHIEFSIAFKLRLLL